MSALQAQTSVLDATCFALREEVAALNAYVFPVPLLYCPLLFVFFSPVCGVASL